MIAGSLTKASFRPESNWGGLVAGRSNGIIRLEAVKFGGKWITSLEALQRFASAQTQIEYAVPELPRSPAERQRASELADAFLDSVGI
jgi:hypothetical protein